MKSGPTFGSTRGAFRAVAVAAVLACGAGASLASDASLTITSFSVSTSAFSGTFAFALDRYQSLSMAALDAGGLYGQSVDNFSADDWSLGLNRLAQTSSARATGNTVRFTDASTALDTAGFVLAAQAVNGSGGPLSLPNSANASAVQSGTFMLLDETGNAAAGTITFDLDYAMSVAAPNGTSTRYAQTALNVLSSSDAGGNRSFDDGLLSDALSGGAGTTSGHFSWSYTLAAGQSAYYTLSGSAVAVAAVPEPETYVFMAAGLLGIAVASRRRRAAG